MLTPAFKVDQNTEFLLLTIKAPYVKSNDVEIFIDGKEFKFYVKPYFLRLYLPSEVVEDGRESAKYDISTGVFDIKIPKKNHGENFPNLDLLTTLLAPKKGYFKNPLIEVVTDRDDFHNGDAVVDEEESDNDSVCWEIEQEVYEPTQNLLTGYKYGFANRLSGVFERLQDEISEMIDLQNPENTCLKERKTLRLNAEISKFDKDHYVADYFDDIIMNDALNYKAPWDVEYDRLMQLCKESNYPEVSGLVNLKGNLQHFHEDTIFNFSEHEKDQLLQLPNKDFLLSKDEEKSLYFGLVDIIFAYAYNIRTTEGENTSESAWTITKLSSTLSWFDSFINLHNVMISCARRCLCYPLYRSWKLFKVVLRDVKRIFILGKRWVLRCLLDVYEILQHDENKYILNDIYITDYCVWVQNKSSKKILSLANKIQCIEISKSVVELNLIEIENEAKSMMMNPDLDSGSECDSDSDSATDCSNSSGGSEETSSNSTGEDESALDSDDISDNEELAKPSQEIDTDNKDMNIPGFSNDNDIEVIRTGIEELLSIDKYVSSMETKEE